MLEGKVLKDFNDGENNLKNYSATKEEKNTYRGEDKRYNELKAKGFVGEGKVVEESAEDDGKEVKVVGEDENPEITNDNKETKSNKGTKKASK